MRREVLDKGYIELISVDGTDNFIRKCAQISFNNYNKTMLCVSIHKEWLDTNHIKILETQTSFDYTTHIVEVDEDELRKIKKTFPTNMSEKSERHERHKDETLLRYLMKHRHTSPFEMATMTFMVQVPMDCWRQWIRHRTASVNEYSTRYTEALDFFQVTSPEEWRLQATDNKQGSGGYIPEYIVVSDVFDKPDDLKPLLVNPDICPSSTTPLTELLSSEEKALQDAAHRVYQLRLQTGVAKEQARKDLPLSTYTRAIWKCDLHNIFHFLKLRMDKHAQMEIRAYANTMAQFVQENFPIAYSAFEDYVLNAETFSIHEMNLLKHVLRMNNAIIQDDKILIDGNLSIPKPATLTSREWKDFLRKLQCQ